MFRSACLAFACLALAASPAAFAETPSAQASAGQVTTIVMVKTPPGISREQIEAGFKQAVPLYQGIPGLVRKYFIVNGDCFGGMYLWKDRASAEAWYTDAWRAKAKATYGTEPQLIYFDSPLQIDGSAKVAGQ